MAQTIEEIAEILRTLKLDTDINADETGKSLALIGEKLDEIKNDYETNKIVKDYLTEIRSKLEERYNADQSKYDEFGQAFRYITSNQELAAKTSDIDSLIQKVDENLSKVNDELSERISLNFDTTRDLIENINQEISRQHAVMQNERQSADEKQSQSISSLADDIRALGENLVLQSSNYRELMELKTSDIKDYINSSSAVLASSQSSSENKLVEKLNVLENLNHGFEANIIDVNNSLQSIIQNIMSMDPTVQNDIIKKELENIYLATNGILSSLQIFDQKNDELARAVSQLLTRENFDVAQQKIEDVIDRVNDLDAHVNEIGLSLDFDTVNNKIDALAYVIDNVKNLVQEVGENEKVNAKLDDLDRKFSSIITEDDFNAFRGDLTDFIQKIVDNSNFLNNDLVENKEKIEQILKSLQSLDFMDKLNDIAENVDAISATNENAITTSMNEMSAKLDDISFDFHQKAGENVETLTSAISIVSTKLDFVNNYLSQDIPSNLNEIKEMNESIRNFITEISDAYRNEGAVLDDKITERLSALQSSFEENVNSYYEKLSDLKKDSDEFNKEFVDVLNGKADDIVDALEPVKTSLQSLLDNDFSSNLTELKEQLAQIYTNVNTQMQMSLGQNQTLVEGLEKIYTDTVSKINDVNDTMTSQAQSNLEMIKSAVEDISRGVENSLENNSQVINEWKSLLTGIDEKINELTSNYSNMFSNMAVDVTNALNVKLESVLEDLKGYIGVPVSANDLMWTVDSLKTELAAKFTELENKQSSKEDDNDTKEEILLILNQLGVKVEELGVHYSNDEFNEILGNNKMQIMSGLKDLKNIILIAMKEVAKSSAESMDAMHEKIDALLSKEQDEELHTRVAELDAKADEIITKLDNLPSANDTETTDVLISLSGKIDNVSETNEKNSQALGAIYEKVDALGSNDDGIANSLVNIAEKFSGIRQNTEQLTNELASVNETVETMNIRTDSMSSAVSEITEKTDNVDRKTDELVQSVNTISDKLDTFAGVEDQITQSLDLISNKLDSNETDEQLTQGMQYLNEKMDSMNETDERITRTMDVVLDKIETFSVSDDEISQSLNNLSDKVEMLGTNSDKVVENVDELSNKVEALGEESVKVFECVDELNRKIETIGTDSERVTDSLDMLSNKIETFGNNDERVIEAVDTLAQKIEASGEQSERSKEVLDSINDKVEMVGDASDKINDKLDILSEKVEKFSSSDGQLGLALDNIAARADELSLQSEKSGQLLEDLLIKTDAGNSQSEKLSQALNEILSRTDILSSQDEQSTQVLKEILSHIDISSIQSEKNSQTLDDVNLKLDAIAGNDERIANTFAALQENVSSVGEVVAQSMDSVASKFDDNTKNILGAMELLADKASENKQEIIDNITDINSNFEEQKTVLKDTVLSVTEKMSENKQAIVENVKEVSDKITSAAKLVMNSINEVSDKTVSTNEILSRSINVITDKVANDVSKLDTSVDALSNKVDVFAENDEKIADAIREISDKVDILKVDTTKEHVATSLDMLNDKADAAHDYDTKLAEAMEGLSVKMDTFSIVDDQLLRKSSEISDKADNIASIADQMTGVLNNIAENAGKINDVNETVDRVAGFAKNIANSLGQVTEKIESNDKDVKQTLAEFGQKFDDYAFNDGAIVKTMEVLSDKIDVFKFNTNNEHIVSSLDSLHEKVGDCYNADVKLVESVENIASRVDNSVASVTDNIKNDISDFSDSLDNVSSKIDSSADSVKNTLKKDLDDIAESVEVVSAKIDTFAEADDRIHDTLIELTDKIDVVKLETNNDHIISNLKDVNSKVDDLTVAGDQIENTLQVLQDKVVALSEKDVFDGFDVEGEIKNIKSLISAQRQYLEDTEISDRTIAMDDCLQELQKKIDVIAKDVNTMDSNANEIKESLMAAIASVFEQISFIEETEEIKGFVEEKTDEISNHIKEVQHQLRQIASNTGDDTYSYSLQDVETDIAKLRMILNDISDAAPNDELNQLANNVSKIENTVKDLQTTLTQEEFAKFKEDFDKINEDIVSISTRTNTLLLNSDNSYKSLNEGLDAFRGMVNNLNEKVNYLDNTEIQKRIERKITAINNAMNASANSNKVIREVLMYLGEWVDNATVNMNSLSDKVNEIDNVSDEISQVKNTISDLKNYVPEKADLIKTLEDKFEEQQERIDRLEMKLERVLGALEETDETKLNKKVDKIEKLINKLNMNVEKLASYVDEE